METALTVVDLDVELLGLHLRVLVAHPEIASNIAGDLALGNLAREGAVEEPPRDALHQADEEEDLRRRRSAAESAQASTGEAAPF